MVVDDLNAGQRQGGVGFFAGPKLNNPRDDENSSKVIRIGRNVATCDEPVRQCWELISAKMRLDSYKLTD